MPVRPAATKIMTGTHEPVNCMGCTPTAQRLAPPISSICDPTLRCSYGVGIVKTRLRGQNGQIKKTTRPKKEMKQEEKAPVYVPGIPEPTKRAELLQHWINLTLDDKTANKMLWISDAGSKVSRKKEEVCPVLDGPSRYEYSPQVVCKEGIWNSRAYFEVQVSGWVVVGITYEDTGRRANSGSPSGLGENDESWGVCWDGNRYQIWFDGQNHDIVDVPYSATIGLYVDQPAGIISFYTVNGEGAEREVTLLHRMETTILRKLLPGFWVGILSTGVLLKP